jgi:hypothetical protein
MAATQVSCIGEGSTYGTYLQIRILLKTCHYSNIHTSRLLFVRRYMRNVYTINPEFAQNSVLNDQTCETGRNNGSVNVL